MQASKFTNAVSALSSTQFSMLAGLLIMLAKQICGNASLVWHRHQMLLWQVVPTFRTSPHQFPVQNHLAPCAMDVAGMANAAATTGATAAGTSSGLPVPPHTGHEDEVMKMMILVPKLNISADVKLSDLG
ncbi:hypothetical protein VaNZ11_007360 [Volvox africanus]|uniref:Uncharacterized protein n=1 Tax=Volvox africanus TaxID=51714 RepID=A0ABQ5S3B9_9CHLO|nr:hypothetical protein VaNZ11_007360 [Volvox africanus]